MEKAQKEQKAQFGQSMLNYMGLLDLLASGQ